MNANTLRNATLAAALVVSNAAMAHGGSPDWTPIGPVVYTNAAYTRAIPGSPNPAAETTSASSALVYTNLASGPAIYSYPNHAMSRRAVADKHENRCDDRC